MKNEDTPIVQLTAPFITRLAIVEQKIKKVQEEIWGTSNEQ